ncbi:MAG TPA: type IV pilus modification protein PilV [Gallionella sp.]|nr:type IV pilus modification protein PilV [Gallionella sp.]
MGIAIMDNLRPSRKFQSGTSMVEVLVTLVILLVGLLGIAGLQIQAHQAELESYQRVQALILLEDMVDRLNNNRNVATCYAFTTNPAGGTPFLGVDPASTDHANPAAGCAAGTTAQQDMALADLAAWNGALQGAAETTSGGTINAGAMIGARGCIVLEDAANRVYRVSISWQGRLPTIDPALSDPVLGANNALTCGRGNYGDERMRRIVSTTVRIGLLS